MHAPHWWQPTWNRRIAIALAVWVGIWLLAWGLVPPLAKYLIGRQASEALGRTVSVEAVDFRPWSLELTLHGLKVGGAKDVAEPQLSVRRIYLDAELQSLFRLAPVVDAIQIEEPVVRLAHLGGGRYDIDDVLARFKPAPDSAPGEPAHFALYNVVVQAAQLDFADRAVGRTHLIRDLSLNLPFLSNLDALREVKVAPALAFTLNGSRFDTRAETTPFAQTRKTDATIRLAGLDLKPYLGYVPAGLPWRLHSAVVDADLQVAFEQRPQVAVRVRGSASVRDVRVGDAQEPELLTLERVQVKVRDLQPLAGRVHLEEVALAGPRLKAARDRAGRINLLKASAAPARTGSASTRSQGVPWQLRLDRLVLENGHIGWTDALPATQGGSAALLGVESLGLQVKGIHWPMERPMELQGAFQLRASVPSSPVAAAAPKGVQRGRPTPERRGKPKSTPPPVKAVPLEAGADAARFEFAGTASDRAADLTATVADLRLAGLAPYLQTQLAPVLDGRVEARVGLQWAAPQSGAPSGSTRIRVERLGLEDLRLGDERTAPVAVRGLQVEGADIDWVGRAVSVGRVTVRDPRLTVEREADGRWAAQRWLKASASPPPAPAPGAPASAGPSRLPTASGSPVPKEAERPWAIRLADLRVDGGVVGWRDASPGQTVSLDLSSLSLRVQDLSLPDGKKPAAVQLAARVASGKGEPGRIGLRGRIGVAPWSAQGTLDVVRLPVHALAPYAAEQLAVELLRADTHFKGQFRAVQAPSGLQAAVTGDLSVEDLRALTRPTGAGVQGAEELLNWKSLNLRGLAVALDPGQAPRVDLREATLSDFFARVIIHESGRINLQDIVRSSGGGTATVALPPPAGGSSRASAPASAPPASPAPATAAAQIRVGPISLVGGRVLFSDRFIRPNYTANLTELTGRLGAFSSVPAGTTVQMADLDLKGRAEGTASLEITGRLNPLAQPLALDIRGKVRDLELPPLSPYTIKYAGHGIERGKLSVDVAYTVQPDGRLTASNQIVLNQLRFGDKVEGATASLPVKLAVALLADRNGVIDINLPISGSLNDPQFSLGPIIVKVIVNLIVKAVTAPFALLANALGGGGDELSQVVFAPGSAVLTASAREGLDKVVRALQDRPALRLTVVGTAHPEFEREGLKRERLQALVVAEKRRATATAGAAPAAPVVVSESEYPALLREVYRRADIPKPRNLVGLAKDLPVNEMQTLLLSHMVVTQEQMRELALQRAVAIKDHVASRQLPTERLFLGAPRLGGDSPGAAPAGSEWKPRAELNLTLQ